MSVLGHKRAIATPNGARGRVADDARAGGGRATAANAGSDGSASGPAAMAPAQGDASTIFQKGAPGRRAFVCPPVDVPPGDPEQLLPARFRRDEPPRLQEVSEPEIVRHYVRLSKRNFDLDSGFYPLGSCTMKHNPRMHERVAALAGHARLHPLQDAGRAQGALELMWNLQQALAEISGLEHVSLQPSAGSAGELAGVLLTRAYHEDRASSDARCSPRTPRTGPTRRRSRWPGSSSSSSPPMRRAAWTWTTCVRRPTTRSPA